MAIWCFMPLDCLPSALHTSENRGKSVLNAFQADDGCFGVPIAVVKHTDTQPSQLVMTILLSTLINILLTRDVLWP